MAEGGGDGKAGGGASPVFISYASQDGAVATALVEALERHGIACWIAPRNVDAGALYADAIVSGRLATSSGEEDDNFRAGQVYATAHSPFA